MIDNIHLLLFVATVTLIVQATKRSMAGSLSLVSVICLVAAVVLLSYRNRSLNSEVKLERQQSASLIEEKSTALQVCSQDLENKKSSITDLEGLRDKILGDKAQLEKEVENLRSEVAAKNQVAATVERLNADVADLTSRSDALQHDLDAAQQQISSLNSAKADLQASLNDAQQKLAAAESAQAAEAAKAAEALQAAEAAKAAAAAAAAKSAEEAAKAAAAQAPAQAAPAA